MKDYCTHYSCRCEAARELAWMADTLGRVDLLAAAIEVHSQEVCCRRVPRNPAVPFYDKEAHSE